MSKNFLDEIVETKKREVSERSSRVSVEALRDQIASMDRPRNFFQAVTDDPKNRRRSMNLIAEVKKASPSAGVIREDFDPVAIASVYANSGANAISVLTDEKYFQGRLEYIQQVRSAVGIPVLRKDFIIDAYQVYESRAAGADAILLIAECLETSELIDLQILATELNLTCLIEVHDIENLMRVRDQVIGFPHRSYSLLGINNRDLRTMQTSLSNTLRMSELVEDRSVLVSESGIRTREDVLKLVNAGVRTALVGESLMRAGDVSSEITKLFRE